MELPGLACVWADYDYTSQVRQMDAMYAGIGSHVSVSTEGKAFDLSVSCEQFYVKMATPLLVVVLLLLPVLVASVCARFDRKEIVKRTQASLEKQQSILDQKLEKAHTISELQEVASPHNSCLPITQYA